MQIIYKFLTCKTAIRAFKTQCGKLFTEKKKIVCIIHIFNHVYSRRNITSLFMKSLAIISTPAQIMFIETNRQTFAGFDGFCFYIKGASPTFRLEALCSKEAPSFPVTKKMAQS